MFWFKMADIGFGIDGREKYKWKTGKYLSQFAISETMFYNLKQQIEIKIIENNQGDQGGLIDTGKYMICEKERKKYLVARFGHYREALIFCPDDWSGSKMKLQVNPGIYTEEGITLNQFLSMAGIHSAFISRDAVLLHASYIQTPKGAVLFTAPSQTGKSTQASLWERFAGAEIINGDRAIVRKKGEQWFAYGISVCGSSDICKNKEAPVRVIIVLEQGKENTVQEMSRAEKYRSLLLASALYNWDIRQVEKVTEIILRLMEEVRVVRFICRPDEDAVRTLQRHLRKVEEDDS